MSVFCVVSSNLLTIYYMLFCCFSPSKNAPIYPGISCKGLVSGAVPQSHQRGCLLGYSPQRDPQVKLNTQLLGCAFSFGRQAIHQSNILTVYGVQQGEYWIILTPHKIEKWMLSTKELPCWCQEEIAFPFLSFDFFPNRHSCVSTGVYIMHNTDAQFTLDGRG